MKPLYPSSNAQGVPDLLLNRLSDTVPPVPAPTALWGSRNRSRAMPGMWLFYVDDYRFSHVWQDPDALVRTACQATAEANFSCFDDTPHAEALWNIYRKRWLGRYWQSLGIEVWVDLFVAPAHEDIALLGVPRGWQRYATRGGAEHLPALDRELEIAREHSDGQPFTLLVYAGGAPVADWSRSHPEVVHVPARTAAGPRPGQGTRRLQGNVTP